MEGSGKGDCTQLMGVQGTTAMSVAGSIADSASTDVLPCITAGLVRVGLIDMCAASLVGCPTQCLHVNRSN